MKTSRLSTVNSLWFGKIKTRNVRLEVEQLVLEF